MRIPDLAAVIEDLKNYHGPFEDLSGRRQLAEAGLPRLLGTIDLIPEGTPQSRLLDLGAAPYLTSVVLDRVWPGQVTRTNYGNGAERRGSVTFANPARGWASASTRSRRCRTRSTSTGAGSVARVI